MWVRRGNRGMIERPILSLLPQAAVDPCSSRYAWSAQCIGADPQTATWDYGVSRVGLRRCIVMYMVRKQLYISDDQERQLKRRAGDLGVSEAELVRRALDGVLRSAGRE